jgi:Flp pilus assembly protein TadG
LAYTASIEKGKSMNVKEKGAASVEFALAALFFITVMFAIIEFGYLYWVNLTMQHAVREGARYAAVTGLSGFTATPQATQAQQRCDAVEGAIKANSMGLYNRVSPSLTYSIVETDGTITPKSSCLDATLTPQFNTKIIMIKLVCILPLITPIMQPFFTNGEYTFSVSATMKNEAFK